MQQSRANGFLGLSAALQIQGRVIGALILRDMRTRFGRTYLSYVIQVGWPTAHMLVLLGSYMLAHRFVPVGEDVAVFPVTGILPYMLCLYPARMTMLGIAANRGLLTFPVVQVPDLIIARIILEMITAFCVFMLLMLILLPFDPDIIPSDPAAAIMAIFATLYFSLSFGFVGAVMYSLTRMFLPVQVGLLLLMYFTSGAFFIPATMPVAFQNLIFYNPLFHCVEWLREAYYQDYGNGMLSPAYLLGFSTVLLLLGFASERLVRGKVLSR